MSISYPLSLPATPSFRSLEIVPDKVAAISESPLSNNQTIYEHSGERWSLSASWPPLTIAQAKDLNGLLISLNGAVGTFLCGDPLNATPAGVATGTPLVNGGSQTGKVISIKGWTPSISGILKRGDDISISNRLYKVTKDANSDGSGIASVDIWPSIRQPAPANNTAVTVQAAKGEFRLSSPPSISGTVDKVYLVSIEAIEVI